MRFKTELMEGMEASLIDLMPGDEAVICGMEEDAPGEDRLRELGLSDGIVLRVIKFAPLGDPIEIKIRGFHLSIRKSLAQKIRVRKRIRNRCLEDG